MDNAFKAFVLFVGWAGIGGVPSSDHQTHVGGTQCEYAIPDEISRAPTFTPFHERPRQIDKAAFVQDLTNEIAEVAEAAALSSVGYWLLVAPRGCIVRVVLTTSSGNARVDSLIVERLKAAEFTRPLLRFGDHLSREKAAPAWLKENLEVERSQTKSGSGDARADT